LWALDHRHLVFSLRILIRCIRVYPRLNLSACPKKINLDFDIKASCGQDVRARGKNC
jgi:hypothetical protein